MLFDSSVDRAAFCFDNASAATDERVFNKFYAFAQSVSVRERGVVPRHGGVVLWIDADTDQCPIGNTVESNLDERENQFLINSDFALDDLAGNFQCEPNNFTLRRSEYFPTKSVQSLDTRGILVELCLGHFLANFAACFLALGETLLISFLLDLGNL